jgi:hypothetical protein
MSTPIRILLTPTTEEVVVHHIPCRIRYDGPAKVSTYFTPTRAADGAPGVAHFRGRELAGHASPLPAGVSGVVFRELVGGELAVALAGEGGGGGGAPAGGAAPPSSAVTAAQRLALLDEEEEEGGGGGGDFDGGFFGEGMDGSGSEAGGGGGEAGASAPAPAAAAAAATSATRVWAVDGRFRALTSWLHDAPATEHDLLPRALAWMKIAKQLHAE